MITRFLWKRDRTSLAVQWLQRSASSADGVGLICMVQSKKKKKRREGTRVRGRAGEMRTEAEIRVVQGVSQESGQPWRLETLQEMDFSFELANLLQIPAFQNLRE